MMRTQEKNHLAAVSGFCKGFGIIQHQRGERKLPLTFYLQDNRACAAAQHAIVKDKESMEHKLDQIIHIMRHDPMKRGLASIVPPPNLSAVLDSILRGERFMILTGFPILAAGIGESDGPSGAVQIAYALTKMGKACTIVTDRYSDTLVRSCCEAIDLDVPMLSVPLTESSLHCASILEQLNPTHIITIERPSKGADGKFHNMSGADISHMVADTDSFLQNPHNKITTISIGDGGNECGMGSFRDRIVNSVKNGSQICAVTTCDFPLAAGVSNWWGWGLASALSVRLGVDLLLPFDAEVALLSAINRAGGVDGTKGIVADSVDGLDYEEYLEVHKRLRDTICV